MAISEIVKGIPYIPLRGQTFFPGTIVGFDIGRDKSLAAVDHAMNGDKYIAVSAQRDPSVSEPKKDDCYMTGTIIRVRQVVKKNEEYVRILVVVEQRIRIDDVYENGDMLCCDYAVVEDYDDDPDDLSLENNMRQSISLIARMPAIMTYAYQVKRRNYDHKSMFFHPVPQNLSVAEAILYSMRPDKSYTMEEAHLLDLCLMLHAEHGGGNNSTFTTRVLSSSGTDTYATISAAIGSLKGHKHGGANIKVMQMLKYLKEGIANWRDEDEVADFLARIIRGEEGDHSGLIYGMGHAVYTKSDPRAVILKKYARDLAEERGFGDEFRLLETVERLTPEVFATVKGSTKAMCANVDMYSGLVYRALGIPSELFTPLFAVARCAGWCAHRTEELYTGGRIMRPAYKSLAKSAEYVPMSERE